MTMFAVTGDDGCVCVYNYKSRNLLARAVYPAGGSAIIWLNEKVCGNRLYMLAAFRDGCIRLLTIHNKRGKQDRAELSLVHVVKPHASAVTAMTLSHHGRTLITAGADGSVWFFSLTLKSGEFSVVPLGFTDFRSSSQPVVEETVVNIELVVKNERKFVLLTSIGRLVEMKLPSSSDIKNTEDSYYIDSLVTRTWTFQSVKSEILRDEAVKKHNADKERKREQLRKSIEQRQNEDIEVDVENEWNRLELQLKVDDMEWSEPALYQPDPPSPALMATVEATGHFYLLMDGYDAGWLYTASLSSSQQVSSKPKARRLPGLGDTIVTVRRLSPDKHLLALGLGDGCVQVHQYNSHEPWRLDQYWRLAMHDNTHGRVTDIQFTSDLCFMLSSGLDGNIFMYEISGVKSGERLVTAARPNLPDSDTITRVDDLDDPQAPCLQQLRETAAKTARLQLAEQRRSAARQQLRQLRKQYKQLMARNQSELPASQQLLAHELVADSRVLDQQLKLVEERVSAASRQMAWTAERHRVAVEQIQGRYQHRIRHQHVIVRAFSGGLAVWTQRMHELPDIPDNDTANTDEILPTPHILANQSLSAEESMGADAVDNKPIHEGDSEAQDPQLSADLAPAILTALARMSARRQRRANRRQQWLKLMAAEPQANQPDPDSEQKLKHALETLGHFQLRSCSDYVTDTSSSSSSQKFTTADKRRHVLRIQREIYDRRRCMNEKVLALRERKRSVINQLHQCLVRAQQLQQRHLPVENHVRLPSVGELVGRSEEDQGQYIEEQIMVLDEATLSGYRSSALQSLREDTGGVITALATGDSESGVGAASSVGNVSAIRRRSVVGSSRGRNRHMDKIETRVFASVLSSEALADSELLRQVRHYHQLRALSERDALLRQVDELLRHFDSELSSVWSTMLEERCRLKQAELLLLTACQELSLMEEFEERERSLQFQLSEKTSAHNTAQTHHAELARRQLTPQSESDELARRLHHLAAEITTTLAGSDKYGRFLARVYRRKPARSQLRARGPQNSSLLENQKYSTSQGSATSIVQDSDLSSSSSSSLSSDSDETGISNNDTNEENRLETQHWDLNQCPPGCDPNLYEWVLKQREDRYDTEQQLDQQRRNLEQIQQLLNKSQHECNSTADELVHARQQLHKHQLAKLACLNQVPVTITLLLHQTRRLGSELAHNDDLSMALLIPRAIMSSLAARVDELLAEWRLERQLRKASREKLRNLIIECSVSEKRVAHLSRQCDEAMVAKFGRKVEVEYLEAIAVNVTVEQMRCEVQRRVEEINEERRQRQHKLASLRSELDTLVRNNTRLTNTVHTLRSQCQSLATSLNSSRAGLLNSSGSNQQQEQQLQLLTHTVAAQLVKIEELKREMCALIGRRMVAVRKVESLEMGERESIESISGEED